MAKTIADLSKSLKDYLNDLGLTETQVQELIDKFEDEKIGDISQLNTEEKGNLVGAINEINSVDYLTESELKNLKYLQRSSIGTENIIGTAITDLNDLRQNYCSIVWQAANIQNLPPGESGAGGMIKCTVTLDGQAQSTKHIIQEYYRTNPTITRCWMRFLNSDNSDTWSPWQLVSGCPIIYNPDLNDIKNNCNIYVTSPINGPAGDSTGNWYVECMFRDNNYGYQRATRNLEGDNYLPKYERTYYGGTWTAWRYL